MQIPTHKVHRKFNRYWSEYEKKDFFVVCKEICRLIDIKGDPIDGVKNNWAKVCQFFIDWEGRAL